MVEAGDDVLGQPTRARLFDLLARSAEAMSTNDLAEAVGLHPTGVRVHLQRLRQAGLVIHERATPTRGRPRSRWQIAPDAAPGAEPPEAYRTLARWLARSSPATPARLQELERAGREVGREVQAVDGHGPLSAALGRSLTALGFAPQRERRPPDRVVFRLGSCPYRDAVRENPAAVCGLHRGLTQGMLDKLGADATLVRFEARDPDAAGCVIEIAGLRDEDMA